MLQCAAVVLLRHDAFPSVLNTFPNRICPECDGYLASRNCEDIGDRYLLYVSGKPYLLSVADCAQPGVVHTMLDKYDAWGDLDQTVWNEAGFASKPTRAILCPNEGRAPPIDRFRQDRP